MRWLRIILPLLLLSVVSCQRRPFADQRSRVVIHLTINTDIVNHEVEELPQNIRVDLYDSETGQLRYTDYVGPTGGDIHPVPGTYDLLLYNIGMESTLVQNERDYDKVEVYTNEVSAFIKSQLAQFLAKRKQAAKERAAKLSLTSSTKQPVQVEDQPVVNQPDHIFVGWYDDLEVPVMFEDEINEMHIEVDANTLVQTWEVEVRNVIGTQWISKMVSLMSGQMGSVQIGPNMATDRIVSVYFDLDVEKNEDGTESLRGKFNTFGKSDVVNDFSLDLNITDIGGNNLLYHFDVTDQFVDNKKQYILITDELVVEEPKVEGGGFQPIVDEWDNIRTNIDL